MDIHQYHKDHYFHEAERRHQLEGALAFPAGVLALIGSALANVITPIAPPVDLMDHMILLSHTISWGSMIMTVFYLVRSRYNWSYRYVATPKKVNEFREGLISYYESIDDDSTDVDLEVEEWLNPEYAECTHVNTLNNDNRSAFLHRATFYLIVALVFTFFSSIPYFADLYIAK